MAGTRQPTDLVVLKGKKHLTKAEIEDRKNSEVTAPNDRVRPPTYLSTVLKKKFRKLAKDLLEIKLIANVDCDALARLLIAQEKYLEVTNKLNETPLTVMTPVYGQRMNKDTGKMEQVQTGETEVVNGEQERLLIIQDRCWKQCRQGASDFGLTVSSRCRLVVPKAQEQRPENKFAKYAK